MTAKETLTDVYRKYRAFMLEYDKAVQIKQAAYFAAAVKYSDMPKSDYSGNSIENALINSIEHGENVAAAFDEYTAARSAAIKVIDTLTNEAEKEILTRRYILFQSWGAIQKSLSYSKRHIYTLHSEAMQNLAPNSTK